MVTALLAKRPFVLYLGWPENGTIEPSALVGVNWRD
jgi:hypothetical protein